MYEWMCFRSEYPNTAKTNWCVCKWHLTLAKSECRDVCLRANDSVSAEPKPSLFVVQAVDILYDRELRQLLIRVTENLHIPFFRDV